MDYLFRDEEFMDPFAAVHKRSFDDDGDVEKASFKLSDEWTSTQNDFMDSIYSLDNDFFKDLDEDLKDIKMNENFLQPLTSDTTPTSPLSSTAESDFEIDRKPIMNYNDLLSSPELNYLSSSASDSGLSSDNVDIDMTPDYDILNADVLMGEGIKIEPSSPIRQHHQPQRQPQSHQLQQPIIQQFVMEASPQKSVQQPKAVVKTQQGVRKQVVRPAGMQMTTIKSPEFKQFDYVHATNVTIAAAPPAAVQPITTMTTATVNMVDTKPRIKILKKVATGGISNGIATHSIATNLTTTTISPATTMATTLTTMKDASGTIVINKSNGNFAGIRKLIHVKKGNQQNSILLPVTFKNGTDIRSIKIIKPSSVNKSPKILMAASNLLQEYKMKDKTSPVTTIPEQTYDDSSDNESFKYDDLMHQNDDILDQTDVLSDSSDYVHDGTSDYPKLVLSNEERRLLSKEGISLPSNYPLTKHEERELKRIRRKIRNKISAQDSRKRKKEYVDGLEERVKKCSDENQSLIQRIKLLQNQNKNLMNQMKKMQMLLTKGTSKTAQPATCLMVLLLSMALVAAPNLRLGKNQLAKELEIPEALEENLLRRNLLFDADDKMSTADDECMNMDDLSGCDTTFANENNEHDYADLTLASAKQQHARLILDFDVDDRVWVPPNKTGAVDKAFETTTVVAAGLKDEANDTQQRVTLSDGMVDVAATINDAAQNVYIRNKMVTNDTKYTQQPHLDQMDVDALDAMKKISSNINSNGVDLNVKNV